MSISCRPFSGLYAPRWQDSARGVICGLTRFANKATSPARLWRPRPTRPVEVLEAMVKDFKG